MIQAQPDPGAEAIRSAGQMVNESIQKRQQLEVMKHELAIKSKLADTEEGKAAIERKKIILESTAKAYDQGIFKNERAAGAFIKMMGSQFGNEFFDVYSEFGSSLAGGQSPEADLRGAQAESERGAAAKSTSEAGLLDEIRKNMAGGSQAGGSVITGGNVGGIQWSNQHKSCCRCALCRNDGREQS